MDETLSLIKENDVVNFLSNQGNHDNTVQRVVQNLKTGAAKEYVDFQNGNFILKPLGIGLVLGYENMGSDLINCSLTSTLEAGLKGYKNIYFKIY